MACLPAPSLADAACAPSSPTPGRGGTPGCSPRRGGPGPLCTLPGCLPCLPFLAPLRAAPRPRRRPPRPRAAPRRGASPPAAAPGLTRRTGTAPFGGAGHPPAHCTGRGEGAAGLAAERRCPVPAPLFATGGRGGVGAAPGGRAASSAGPAGRAAAPGIVFRGSGGRGAATGKGRRRGGGLPRQGVRRGGGRARPPGCPRGGGRGSGVSRSPLGPGGGLSLSLLAPFPAPRWVPEPSRAQGRPCQCHRQPCWGPVPPRPSRGRLSSRFKSGLFPPVAGSGVVTVQNALVIQNNLNIARVVNCCGHLPTGDLYLHLMWRIFFYCPCSCW